ncbi:MAG: DUF559 domain-containing protein [Gemmatimonadetes bacterium]|nr:DUF559 domain-containing protein [Gemmatimonadota bacterium]
MVAKVSAGWKLVRGRRLLGLKFRRQRPIGRFVADFYCHELRLILEVEGGIHDNPDRLAADQERTTILEGLGFRVVRIQNVNATADHLRRLIATLPSPSPVRERGQG